MHRFNRSLHDMHLHTTSELAVQARGELCSIWLKGRADIQHIHGWTSVSASLPCHLSADCECAEKSRLCCICCRYGCSFTSVYAKLNICTIPKHQISCIVLLHASGLTCNHALSCCIVIEGHNHWSCRTLGQFGHSGKPEPNEQFLHQLSMAHVSYIGFSTVLCCALQPAAHDHLPTE